MGIHAAESLPLDENGRPCRSCTSFKSWMKGMSKATGVSAQGPDGPQGKSSSGHSSSPAILDDLGTRPHRLDCPVDRDELGRNTWSFLHTMAAVYPEKPTTEVQSDMRSFMNLFSKFYPCSYCAKDLQDELKTRQPDTSSRFNFSRWMCEIHNSVNKKLGKPIFDCANVDQRWRDGWKDGSCDE